jgi:hypothetical protein
VRIVTASHRISSANTRYLIQVNGTVKNAHSLNELAGTIARVTRALDHGLVVAGRRYVFLAASSSQAR